MVQFVLSFRELDGHISEECSPTDATQRTQWKNNDAKNTNIIGISLSDDHLEHVRGIETEK